MRKFNHIGIPTSKEQPAEGLTVGFIVEEGAPIELMQYA